MRARLRLKPLATVISSLALVLVVGCNPSGGSRVEGGIQGTGFSIGTITGFSSIFVNGKRFSTSDADFEINGAVGQESGLEKGMIVRVDGEWRADDTGTAERVVYDDTLRGPIDTAGVTWNTDTETGELTLLKQTVKLNSQTIFTGKAVSELGPTDRVRISGWNLGNGEFRASLVQTTTQADIEVEGVISKYNKDERTFEINGLVINYSDANVEDDLTIENGVAVEVEGSLNEGEVKADEIDFDDRTRFYRGDDGDDVDLAGPIDSVDGSNQRFVLSGLTVRWDGETDFEDGLSSDDLKAGVYIRVEGEWRSGELFAEEIEPRESDAEVEATVTAIDNDLRELVVGGVTVVVSNETLIVDDEDDKRLTFSDLKVGDFLEVEGLDRQDGTGKQVLRAILIEREDDDDGEFELEGSITAISDGGDNRSITVLGVTLRINGDTEFDDDTNFDDLAIGDEVEVEYKADGGDFLALEVELED